MTSRGLEVQSSQQGCKPWIEVCSLAGTVLPGVPEVTLAFEHEIVEPHEEINTAANDGSQANGISEPGLRLNGVKGGEEVRLVKDMPVVVMGTVARDGSGVRPPSLHTTTEGQAVVSKAERVRGRARPMGTEPVGLAINKYGSDQ